jgi:glycosyltransferase involved in cell wall biosynthesis
MPDVPTTCSIALCTYNGASFLERQLQSLSDQTLRPTEIVISDDGSSDGTLELLDTYAATAPFPVRILRNDRQMGYRANFMKAAAHTRGDLVFFCDQDDVWRPNKLERVADRFKTEGVLLVYHNARLTDAAERPLSALYGGAEQRQILAQQPMPAWHYTLGFTQAFRRDLLAHEDLWPLSLDHMSGEIMAHDQWFFLLAGCFGGLSFLDEELVYHRQHANNTYGVRGASRWKMLMSRFSHNAAWDQLAAEAALKRAEIIDRLGERLPSFRGRARTLSGAYRSTAERHRRRYRAYAAPSLLTRFGAFGHGLLQADHRGRPWGLEPRALPRDFVMGVLAGTGASGPAQ